MLALRDAVPRRMPLAWSEFATLRSLLKNLPRTRSGGSARVVEKAARVRIHFASARPDAALFRMLTGRLAASGPCPPGRRAPGTPARSTPYLEIESPKSRHRNGAQPKLLRVQNQPISDASREQVRLYQSLDRQCEPHRQRIGRPRRPAASSLPRSCLHYSAPAPYPTPPQKLWQELRQPFIQPCGPSDKVLLVWFHDISGSSALAVPCMNVRAPFYE